MECTSWVALLDRVPDKTIIWQVDASAILTATKYIKPTAESSASMKMSARAAVREPFGAGWVETHKWVFGIIRAGNENGVINHASHGTVPAVVLGAT